MGCTPPKDCGLALSRWSCPELAQQIIADGICASISPATVRRWLSEDALKPWQYQSWIFISDPDFAAKAQRVLDLYARVWDGEPLGRNDYVISADEKTSIQARCRCHPTRPPGKARTIRVNNGYHRRGAVAYLAAYDVHHAKVYGRCEDTTGIIAFTNLVTQVMTREPYKSADRVFWIVDNGSSHRGRKAIDRLAEQFPNPAMVHTPVHASWLNQIEIFFSIVQRKLLSPNDFTDLDDVVDRLSDFATRHNQTARPVQPATRVAAGRRRSPRQAPPRVLGEQVAGDDTGRPVHRCGVPSFAPGTDQVLREIIGIRILGPSDLHTEVVGVQADGTPGDGVRHIDGLRVADDDRDTEQSARGRIIRNPLMLNRVRR